MLIQNNFWTRILAGYHFSAIAWEVADTEFLHNQALLWWWISEPKMFLILCGRTKKEIANINYAHKPVLARKRIFPGQFWVCISPCVSVLDTHSVHIHRAPRNTHKYFSAWQRSLPVFFSCTPSGAYWSQADVLLLRRWNCICEIYLGVTACVCLQPNIQFLISCSQGIRMQQTFQASHSLQTIYGPFISCARRLDIWTRSQETKKTPISSW